MCTVVLLRRPGEPWPVVIGANRDEKLDRAWDPPAAWWPDRPGSLGPAPGKRSRGELPLAALEHATAEAAAAAIAALPAAEWRAFNMVVADRGDAFFVRGTGVGRPEALRLPEGVSMVTALDPNDLSSPRTARHLPRFRAAAPPDPDRDDWGSWEALLADHGYDAATGPAAALCVPPTADGFGTVCSSLLGLRRGGGRAWRFAAAAPCRAPFAPLPAETGGRTG